MKYLLRQIPMLLLIALAVLFVLPGEAQAASASNLEYEIENGEAVVVGYKETATGELSIPATYNGYPVTTIRFSAFFDCEGLTSLVIPSSVTEIEMGALYYLENLTSIKVDSKNTVYSSDSSGVLFNKAKDSIIRVPAAKSGKYTIPTGVQTIEPSAFANCTKITGVTIPNTVKVIGDNAFDFCESLTTIAIPEGVTTIGWGAFSFCDSLTTVTIPKSVTQIDGTPFTYCGQLTAIKVDAGNTKYSSDSYGVLFNKSKTTLIQAPGAIAGNYSIPTTVTNLESAAFDGCLKLTGVTIPNGIKKIPENAFSSCDSLKTITIPASVTSIEGGAFAFCSSLTSVSIPKSVTQLASTAFVLCENLTAIHVDAANPNYSNDNRGVVFDKANKILVCAPGGISGEYAVPAGVVTIGDTSFNGCEKLTGITMPDSVTSIAPVAFSGCTKLESVIFGNGLQEIEVYAFDGCFSLKTVVFTGDAIQWGVLSENIRPNIYYRSDLSGWTEAVRNSVCPGAKWIPYKNGESPWDDVVAGELDGVPGINSKDVAYLLWHTLFPSSYPIAQNADFNHDGKVDSKDVAYLLWHTLFPSSYPL